MQYVSSHAAAYLTKCAIINQPTDLWIQVSVYLRFRNNYLPIWDEKLRQFFYHRIR